MRQSASLIFRDYRASDRQWVRAANLRHYTEEEGFDPSFTAAIDAALDDIDAGLEDASNVFVIVEEVETGCAVGCIFLSAGGETTGRIRLFYLDEACRGQGAGRAMLDHMIGCAFLQGMERIQVSTYDRHEAACRLYRSAGFSCSAQAPSIAFGQEMRQINFEKRLASELC